MDTQNLPNLDESVLAALDFFQTNPPARLNLKKFHLPLVAASGNAYNTAQAIFAGQPAIIANESNFRQILKAYRPLIKNKIIKEALIISASGEKDSVWEIIAAKRAGLKTYLLTCHPDSSAARLTDSTVAYKKLPEPYTYNTSTYLGMFLGATGENPQIIKNFIRRLKLPRNFSKFSAYAFILPDDWGAIAPMLEIKRDELFGPHLALRSFSAGAARHAKFVNVWNKELVISLGQNKYFGMKKSRWEIKLPTTFGPAGALALTYYLVGKIQASRSAYFKNNIARWCQEGPKAYGQKKSFPVIVK